jgi:hypothetical protein
VAFLLKCSDENVSDVEAANLQAKMALALVRDNSVVSRLVEDMESHSRSDEKYPQAARIVKTNPMDTH